MVHRGHDEGERVVDCGVVGVGEVVGKHRLLDHLARVRNLERAVRPYLSAEKGRPKREGAGIAPAGTRGDEFVTLCVPVAIISTRVSPE
jgi:hypothetical protein